MARPKKQVNEQLLRTLAGIHCTVEEMAIACGCSKDTLERRFMHIITAGRADGKSSLRRLQWQTAQKGNATMQIWLGKQLLGQRDFKMDLADLTDEMLAAEVRRRMNKGSGDGTGTPAGV